MRGTCLACDGELSLAEVQFNVLVCSGCAGCASGDRALRERHWELSRSARLGRASLPGGQGAEAKVVELAAA